MEVRPWLLFPRPSPSFQPILCSILLPRLSPPMTLAFPGSAGAAEAAADDVSPSAFKYFSCKKTLLRIQVHLKRSIRVGAQIASTQKPLFSQKFEYSWPLAWPLFLDLQFSLSVKSNCYCRLVFWTKSSKLKLEKTQYFQNSRQIMPQNSRFWIFYLAKFSKISS